METSNNMLVLTPSALLTFLAQVEELKTAEISLVEDEDAIRVQIGDGTYVLESPQTSEVEISEDAVEELDSLNEEGYEQLAEDEDINLEDVAGEEVEGGVIKELIKTLAVGGLVRLTKDAILKS